MSASLLDLDDEALAELCGPPSYRVGQVKRWLYREAVTTTEEMTDLPKALRASLEVVGASPLVVTTTSAADDDMTVKWLFMSGSGSDACTFETVLMRYPRRATVCVSTQAGCAQGCPFCATGQSGFQRHLSAGEIVAQVLEAQRHVRRVGDDRSPDHVTNVVFMGMGEPLANYTNTVAAVRRLQGDVGLAARSITVSTIGIPERVRLLAHDLPQVTLAVSLHAADDTLRDRLVPPNRRWPIAEVLAAVADYRSAGGRRVTFEYTLMDGVNDSLPQAAALAALLRPQRAHVNCIPMNPTADPAFRPPPPRRCRDFVAELSRLGLNATLRHNRGAGIDAACGQLRADAVARPEAS